MKKIIFVLFAIVAFSACDKSDSPLEYNSLSVENQSFTGCIQPEELTKSELAMVTSAIILEVEGNMLRIIRQGEFSCGAKMEVKVTNEGNTITLEEVNKGQSAFCSCPGEYKADIKGMKDGVYTICVVPEDMGNWTYKPFIFTFEEGVKTTVELELVPKY